MPHSCKHQSILDKTSAILKKELGDLEHIFVVWLRKIALFGCCVKHCWRWYGIITQKAICWS